MSINMSWLTKVNWALSLERVALYATAPLRQVPPSLPASCYPGRMCSFHSQFQMRYEDFGSSCERVDFWQLVWMVQCCHQRWKLKCPMCENLNDADRSDGDVSSWGQTWRFGQTAFAEREVWSLWIPWVMLKVRYVMRMIGDKIYVGYSVWIIFHSPAESHKKSPWIATMSGLGALSMFTP
jgi:hypothetical protein